MLLTDLLHGNTHREAIATESTEEVRFHYVFIDGYWKVMYRTPEGWKMKALALALRRCPK